MPHIPDPYKTEGPLVLPDFTAIAKNVRETIDQIPYAQPGADKAALEVVAKELEAAYHAGGEAAMELAKMQRAAEAAAVVTQNQQRAAERPKPMSEQKALLTLIESGLLSDEARVSAVRQLAIQLLEVHD